MRARHVHLERAHSDMILVGRGTYLADAPQLDVRLPGLEEWSPRRALLTRGEAVDGWEILQSPQDVYRLHDVNDLLVEGGSATATAFLAADLVDRILIYRAPIIVGEGKSIVRLCRARRDRRRARPLARWSTSRALGVDRLEVYERVRGGLSGGHVHRDRHRRRHRPQRRAARRPAPAHRLRLRPGDRRPRRLDRLLGRLPDRGRQGRGLVRGRRLGRNRVAHRAGPVAAKARGSTSSARCASATSSAAISSPAMSMRSARSSASAPKAIRPGSASASPRELGADDRRQGLDRARRRVADRQRGARRRGRHDPFLGQHHPPHRRSTRRFGEIAAGRQLNVEIDVLARYIDRMLAARAQ